MNEIWKTIKDYRDYAVSAHGRVKRIVDSNNNSKAGKIIKDSKNNCGYHYLSLWKNGIGKSVTVHRLVLKAFRGELNLQTNHIDGNKDNNYLNNLEYLTVSENHKHAHRIGLKSQTGEKNNASKLNNKKVLMIRAIYPTCKQYKLAEMFNVTQTTISAIINKRLWAHI